MFASLHTAHRVTDRLQTTTHAGMLGHLMQNLRQAAALRHQRHTLAELDDATLADIGLTRDQALAEAARPLWDVPATWRR
ncbi:DUF1127 domain-containing protein [Rhodobacter ferrooxidans]|uniref:YjiS-like domain-containing protein n=1 Tax=Rhodobacter ferrooxidans TaxID=371731 RepID=C8RXP8_9RHOB|nr:protein of unknown function DUF1127 [Rhodobacter sp. SW2]